MCLKRDPVRRILDIAICAGFARIEKVNEMSRLLGVTGPSTEDQAPAPAKVGAGSWYYAPVRRSGRLLSAR